MACMKEENHFDGGSFFVGMLLIAGIVSIFSAFLSTDTTIMRQAKLPETCRAGQQVLMTTAPTSELYVCESHWVRR